MVVARRHTVVAAGCLAAILLVSGSARAESQATQDLTGAACRAVPRTDIAADPGAPAPVYLDCGVPDRPSGAVSAIALPLSLPADTELRHAALQRAAGAAPAGRDATARMACLPGRWSMAGGIEISIAPCTLNDGGWPEIQVVAAIGQYLFQADGLPAVLPVMQATMLAQADYHPAGGTSPFGEATASRRLLDAAFDGQVHLIPTADIARFSDLTETARLNNSRKNYRAAEDAYREALDIQTRAFGADTRGVGITLVNLALEVSNQQRFDESAALFHRADPIIQRLGDSADRARFFSYMAFDAANAGRFADALANAREATALYRQLSESDPSHLDDLHGAQDENRAAMRGELAHSLNTEAAMALRAGNPNYALAAITEALQIVSEENGLPPWWRPEILTTAGEVYAALGRLNDAEKSLRGALIYQERLFGNTAPTAVTLLALGRVYAREELYEDSIRSYNFAISIFEQDDVARGQVVFDQIAPLITATNAISKTQPQDRATFDATVLRAVQLITTGVADQTIIRASARLAAGDPTIEALVSELQEAERKRDEARIELAHETSLPDAQRGTTQEEALLKEINQTNQQNTALTERLRASFPAYANLANPGPVDLPGLQRRLNPHEGLVMIDIGRTQGAVVLVRADGFMARSIDLDENRAIAAVRDLRRAFEVHDGAVGDFDLADAHDLYKTIFGPIEGQLAGLDHLIVIPSGALTSLPMALLVTERPAHANDYSNAAWLVRRYATSETPSIRAFVTLRDTVDTHHAARPFLGIGDPAFEGQAAGGSQAKVSALATLSTQCRDSGPIPPQFLRALAPLPETAGELHQVAGILGAAPGDVLLGASATEAALRAEPLDQFRVLYFATHGLLPGELNCQSEPALALSPPAQPAASKANDGLLEASEIAALRLNADLVVLSACNTAQTGGQFGGEALSGLAQAFFYAGARGLVASHWQVPSSSTVNLMVGMFQRMGPTMAGGAAESLRQSQLALIARPGTAHPFFWAAFTVIGDGAAPSAGERAEGLLTAPRP
jgi:CHAT domain-containing protein